MKLYRILLLLLAASVLAVSCDDDDDDTTTDPTDPTAPTVTESSVTYGSGATSYTVRRIVYKDNGGGIGTRTLAATEGSTRLEHVMDGFVFVNSGQTLTIQPGAVIKANPGTGAAASGLLVARGGTISAAGTAANPIIMTYLGDDVENNDEPGDFVPGQWAGLGICGNASTNLATGEKVIEGIPTTETRGLYGGSNDTENSGTLTYVSIRNTGTLIGPNSELQGLTLGAVGSGTTINHIETIFSNDDGVEVFGGTVNLSNFLGAFIDDDIFDLDQGWRGRGQFWFGYQYDNDGNRGGEWDGDDATESPSNATANGTPYNTSQVANLTIVANRATGSEGEQGIIMRNNNATSLYNSIIANATNAIRFGQSGTDATRPTAFDHLVARRMIIRSNVFADIAGASTVTVGSGSSATIRLDGSPSTARQQELQDSLVNNNNVAIATSPLAYPLSGRVSPTASNVNPVPSSTAGFPAVATLPTGFTTAAFIGAFNPSVTFASSWANWTFFYQVYGQ